MFRPSAVRDVLSNFPVAKGTPATHLSMAGGMWTVPQAQSARLHAAMEQDRDNGVPFFLVEMRTPVFRMLYDFDFFLPVDAEPISVDRFCTDILPVVHAAVREFYPTADPWTRRAVICQAASCVKEHKGQPRLKSGFHVILPDIFVDRLDALALRAYSVQKLGERGPSPDGEPWSEVVDLCVITDNGLRMIGSNKGEKCKKHVGVVASIDETTGLAKVTLCTRCGDSGRYDAGRPYRVTRVVEGDGTWDSMRCLNELDLMGYLRYALPRLSMQCPPEQAKLVVTYPRDFKLVETMPLKSRGQSLLPSRNDVVSVPGMHHGVWDTRTFSALTYPGKDIVRLFTRAFKTLDQYGGGFVSCSVSMSKRDADPFPVAARFFPKRNYCCRVDREHSSNRVFLLVEYDRKRKVYTVRPGCFSGSVAEGKTESCTKDTDFFTAMRVDLFTTDAWRDMLFALTGTLPPHLRERLKRMRDEDTRAAASSSSQSTPPNNTVCTKCFRIFYVVQAPLSCRCYSSAST